jgi:Phage portal protein
MGEQASSLGHLPGSKWQFDESVAQVFDDMLVRSIPIYPVMRAYVLDYVERTGSGPYRQIAQDEMLHLKAFSRDGVTGLSPIALMRESIGLAQAGEEYQARFFSNDATPPLVLTTPQVLNEEAQKRLRQSWEEGGAGLPNAHKVRVLESGLDVKPVGISNRDAEFLNLRKYQVGDIARIFGVPPHMIGDLDRATFSNIEQLSLEFVTFCLSPWFIRSQQALSRDLMSAKMRAAYFYEFLSHQLIVSDVLQRFQAWNAAIISGWVKRNEVREREGFNPEPGLDVFLEPLNVQQVGATPQPAVKPEPKPAPGQREPTTENEPDDERSALVEAYRELVTDRANRLVRKETTTLRKLSKKHHEVKELEREIFRFYAEFAEADADYTRDLKRELRTWLASGDELEALLVRWEQERAAQIVEREMSKWE